MAVGDGGALGYKSWIGVAEETSWSTKITATSFLEFLSESMNRTRESTKLETINTGRNFLKRFLGNETVQGGVEAYLNVASDAIVKIIKNGLGGSVTSTEVTGSGGTATSSYSHSIAQGSLENSLSSLTIQKRVGDSHIFDFMGCRVNSWSIKGEIGQPLQLSVEFIGRQGSTSSDTVTVALPSVTPLLWDNVTFKSGEAANMTSVLASGTAEKITGFELSFNNNLIADEGARSLGDTTVDFIKYGKADVTLKISQRFDTSTAYDRAFAGTAYSFGLLFNSNQTISALADSTTYSMSIEVPKAYYKTQTPQVGDAGVIMQELEFDVVANSAGADIINTTICNATSSY